MDGQIVFGNALIKGRGGNGRKFKGLAKLEREELHSDVWSFESLRGFQILFPPWVQPFGAQRHGVVGDGYRPNGDNFPLMKWFCHT